jgi:hypothetical protein
MSTRDLTRPLYGLLCLLGAALACGEGFGPGASSDTGYAARALPVVARGTLFVSLLGEAPPQGAPPVRHRTTFVNDDAYRGMEDNDLRGYLDGRFKYAWNQPGQVHVRLGRRGAGERYAEHELFRVVQEWFDVALPPGARVRESTLYLQSEHAPKRCIEILLYEVKRAWNPGTGGTRRDNVSPPKPGEVWWNEARSEEEAWALPGVGRASDADPQADTGSMALASAALCPGETDVTLSAPQLTAYVDAQVQRGEPLRFLLKLDDQSEDRAGSWIAIYSGSTGASRETSRRPRLTLEWEVAALATQEIPVRLERGRSVPLAATPPDAPHDALARARHVVATFVPEPGSAPLHIERSLPARGAWDSLAHPRPLDGVPATLRITAGTDPVALGEPFRDQLRDTWIRTAAPTDQEVPWIFVSPSGLEHRVLASYEEPYRWRIDFLPDEVGPWSYHWSQRFTETEIESPVGRFDVIARELDPVLQSLAQLAARARERGALRDRELKARFRHRLAMLERAGMSLMSASQWRGEEGTRLRAATGEVRAAMGAPAPDPIPKVPDTPPEWADSADE